MFDFGTCCFGSLDRKIGTGMARSRSKDFGDITENAQAGIGDEIMK
jgi:hypothetical protein